MATYATSAEVQARAGNRPITSTSKPSSTDVGAWLDEAEAEILGTLAAGGVGITYGGSSRGFAILRGWIGNYVSGRVRESWAAAGGDGGNPDGRELVAEWRARLDKIAGNPDHFSAMLSAGAAEVGTSSLSSHVTDQTLGLSASDYAPVFTIKGENY